MNTWLVTGAGGMLGANAGSFLKGKVPAVAFARGPVVPAFEGLRVADLRDSDLVNRLIDEIAPKVILHAAALSRHEECERDPELAYQVNVKATRILSEAASRVGAKFVYVSTDAVFDGAHGHYSESDSPNPFSVYGRTKLDGEIAALSSPRALVVRTNFFGWSPSGSRSILEYFINALTLRRVVEGYTNFTVSSMYVQNLLAGVWDLIDKQVNGIVHVSSRDALSKYNYALAVAQEFNFDSSLIHAAQAPKCEVLTRGDRDISLDVSKFELLVGRQAPTQFEGIVSAHADAQSLRLEILTSGIG